jgi:hypothetical protein
LLSRFPYRAAVGAARGFTSVRAANPDRHGSCRLAAVVGQLTVSCSDEALACSDNIDSHGHVPFLQHVVDVVTHFALFTSPNHPRCRPQHHVLNLPALLQCLEQLH